MKSVLYLTAASALFAGSAIASCNADNCLRALRATQTPGRLQAAQSFCAAYTVSPNAVPVPTYAAAACVSNQVGPPSVRLASACACIAAVETTTSATTTAKPTTTAVPTTAVTTTAATTTSAVPSQACAIASSYAAKASASSSTPRIPAAIAYECLKTVPLGKDAAIELVDAIVPYMEWQSDAAYKADPPATYEYPAYDMFKALAKVRENLVNDVYDSEYAFQLDFYVSVIGPGHDGHFVFYPDLLTKVFDFGRQRSLLSITEDGTSLPVIKVYEDVISSPSTASKVVLINGVDAVEYLEKVVYTASFNQDKDAAYNSLFFTKAVYGAAEGVGYFAGAGRTRYIYQGANTTLTFANGTVATFENFANVRSSLAGITDGQSMYTKFCSGTAASAANAAAEDGSSTAAAAAASTSVPGFPAPIDITEDAIVSCYFLEGEGVDNVMVLSLLAFESESIVEFQAVTANCIAQAKAAGKTKLVVDFSANGGGYILLGYDFFRQLFPQTKEDGFSRWKANDGYVAIGEIFSDAVKNIDPYTSGDSTLVNEYESWFNWKYDYTIEGKPFKSFEEKFGPYEFQNTEYTALMKWNLNDNLTTTNSTYGMGIEITGYGSLSNLTQPFDAEDIVILYDGFCASTCTIASEFLRINGGVKSVAMGGRPKEGLIQGVGGIKGSQTLGYSDVYSYVSQALTQATTDEQRAALERYTTIPLQRSAAAALNTRDQILPGNVEDGLPAQFVVEESDCRLYYTAEMATDVAAIWKAAANAAFNGAKCNAGGISSSKINSRVDMRNKNRRSGSSPSGVNKASLAKRKAVAELKAAELESMSSKDLERFKAMYSQRIVV